MSFKVGDRVELLTQDNGVTIKIGAIGTVQRINIIPPQTYYEVKFDLYLNDWSCLTGQLKLLATMPIAKTKFKVGDIVSSSDVSDVTLRWTVIAVGENEIYVKYNGPGGSVYRIGKENFDVLTVTGRDDMIVVYETAECNHDWKIYRGFQHDDEYCTRCKLTRKLSA